MIRFLLILFGITLIGAVVSYVNLSPFKLYPDSYQSLLVAENIRTYGSVVGYLGSNGIVYPDFFSWSHPVYPLLINAVATFTHNITTAARAVAFFAGILAIPLTFYFIKQVFSSKIYGLAGALLIAFSFNHTVWSGFVMTETTGVCMMVLFLLTFFAGPPNKKFGDLRASISGIIFALAVLTRYEYAIILLPIVFYFFVNGKQLMRLFTLLIACGIILALFVWQLYPLSSTFTVVGDQLGSLLVRGGLALLVVFIACISIFLLPHAFRKKIEKYGMRILIGLLWLISAYVLTQYFFGSSQWFLYADLAALRHFIIHDALLSIFSLVGFTMLLTNKNKIALGMFALLSIVFLFAIYHHINPDMERYMTHLIPFLLIPASYAFVKVIQIVLSDTNNNKKLLIRLILLIPLILLLVIQINFTFLGMRYSQDASWYRISYEDKAAAAIKRYIKSNNDILIAAYPEPYYYTLHISTQSIADSSPYVFIDNVSPNQTIMIVEDMGMHADFPHFSNLLDKHLSQYKIATFWVHEKFHYVNTVQNEKYPVVIYKLKLKELQQVINKKGNNS